MLVKTAKKVFSVFLALLITATLFQIAAFAEDSAEPCKHDWRSHSVPTSCEQPAYKTQKCKNCDILNPDKRTVTGPPRGHKWSEREIIVRGDPHNDGIAEQRCEICGLVDRYTYSQGLLNPIFTGTSDWEYFWSYFRAYMEFIAAWFRGESQNLY